MILYVGSLLALKETQKVQQNAINTTFMSEHKKINKNDLDLKKLYVFIFAGRAQPKDILLGRCTARIEKAKSPLRNW